MTFSFDQINPNQIQQLFDLVDTMKDAAISIAEENEPDWVYIENDVWYDDHAAVFRVAHVYEPGCDCCSFMSGVTEVTYEAVAEFIEGDKHVT